VSIYPLTTNPEEQDFESLLSYWVPWLSKKERPLVLNQDSYFPTLMLESSPMSPKTLRSHKTTAMITTAFKIDLMEPAIGMYELTSQRSTPTTTKTTTTWIKGMIHSFFCLDFRKVRHPFNFGDWTCDEAAGRPRLSRIAPWNLLFEFNPQSLTLFSITACLAWDYSGSSYDLYFSRGPQNRGRRRTDKLSGIDHFMWRRGLALFA